MTIELRPTEVVIAGHSLSIEYRETLNGISLGVTSAATLGYVETHESRMYVKDRQSSTQEKDTVLHEILHAIIALHGLIRYTKKEDDEPIVLSLATTLLDTLRRNPQLAAWLIEP